jgi:hypothetical protein
LPIAYAPPVPTPLSPRPPDLPVRCARGRKRPRAIAWFGFTAFWGHLRHLVASAIATENIDSRTWMIPEAPDALLGRVIEVLSPQGAKPAPTLLDAIGEEAWLDFVADTGDDATVSEAVARLLIGEYETIDPDDEAAKLILPRGDVLILGGDLAYPVATSLEMTRRLVAPFNRVLLPASDPKKTRVLLAIPGNHDWYDGLDGFARLCQAPCAFEDPPHVADALHPSPNENPVLAWAEAFARGDPVHKPGAMALAGYVPIQRTSYFRLPLAPGVELFAVDRQLYRLDARQRAYFRVSASVPVRGRLVILPDPARAWGEHRPDGVATLAALGLDPSATPSLLLSGDVHHYERSQEGPSLHVVAGGGGAFLHGSRVASEGAVYPRDVEFPGPRASWAMLARLPWHVARGGAGWLITSIFGLGDAVALIGHFRSGVAPLGVAVWMSVAVAFGAALLVGWRRHRMRWVLPFAMLFGVVIGALPIGVGVLLDSVGMRELGTTTWAEAVALVVAWMLSTWMSGWAFGAMLALIARLGLNHAQPYAALGEPGFKHFVRMRVRQRAERAEVDVFVIGMVDPVRGGDPVLVDSFRWRP